MNEIQIMKALAHPKRLSILQWLKSPEEHFPPHQEVDGFKQGVCVGFIQAKVGLSQSVTSQYMTLLHQAELVIPTRIGKWTYYRRNEETIAKFSSYISQSL
ncbi:MAG: metalloregulator ArsR/SmtB family transcription factor [Cyanobacteria bacterium P01_D01_bin.156]